MVYALILQFLLSGATLVPVVGNWFGYAPGISAILISVTLVMQVLSCVLLAVATRAQARRWDMIYAGTWHLVVCLTSIVVVFVPYVDRGLLVVMLGVHFLPLLTSGWLYSAIGRVWQRWSSADARGVLTLVRGSGKQAHQ
jgi:hypothetical protein